MKKYSLLFLLLTCLCAGNILAQKQDDEKLNFSGMWKVKSYSGSNSAQNGSRITFSSLGPNCLAIILEQNEVSLTVKNLETCSDDKNSANQVKVVWTETFYFDNREISASPVSKKIYWDENKIITERTRLNPSKDQNKKIETTYQLSKNKKKLSVTIKTIGADNSKSKYWYSYELK